MRLDRNNTVLLVVDVQEKLMPVIDGASTVIRNIDRLVRGCHILGVPAILTEQYVKGLGQTDEAVRRAFDETSGYVPIEKSCFSAYGCEAFSARLAALGRTQILVAGVETHVCVYQTVEDLLAHDLEINIVAVLHLHGHHRRGSERLRDQVDRILSADCCTWVVDVLVTELCQHGAVNIDVSGEKAIRHLP